jgi:sulfite exporter TauE/SafE
MTLPPAYAQVLGLGVLWTSIHCIGMCGPLLSGLDIAGVMRGRSRLQGLLGVVAYQAGRGLTYAWLGGLAGLLGAGLGRLATISGALLALAVGLVLIHRTLRALPTRAAAGGDSAHSAAPAQTLPIARCRLSSKSFCTADARCCRF